MDEPIKAVVGFMFSRDRLRVALIRKKRPAFQAGLLNGIGGKVEQCDVTAADAMVREFKEEAHVVTNTDDWQAFLELKTNGWYITFFRGFGEPSDVVSMTDECVEIVPIDSLWHRHDLISNLKWIIALALDPNEYKFPILAEEVQ